MRKKPLRFCNELLVTKDRYKPDSLLSCLFCVDKTLLHLFHAWMIHRSLLSGLTNIWSVNDRVQELDWQWVKQQPMSEKKNSRKLGELLLKSGRRSLYQAHIWIWEFIDIISSVNKSFLTRMKMQTYMTFVSPILEISLSVNSTVTWWSGVFGLLLRRCGSLLHSLLLLLLLF